MERRLAVKCWKQELSVDVIVAHTQRYHFFFSRAFYEFFIAFFDCSVGEFSDWELT